MTPPGLVTPAPQLWPDPSPEVEARMLRTAGGNRAFHNFNNDFCHIRDPNIRRRLALSEIDKIPFGLYHLRTITVAGVGFFTDSYDIFAINMAVQMLGIAFWQDGTSNGTIPANIQVAIKAATSGGAVLGMIFFGYLADRLGRRRMYGIELSIITVATLAQALSSNSTSMSMAGVLIFWRVLMGIGIGGDYPLSAVITAEFAPTKWRGLMMSAVFSMQGLGQAAAAIVALVTTTAFKSHFDAIASPQYCTSDCQVAADRAWRIIVGVGSLPALLALYYRITIPETPRYTFDVARDTEKGGADIEAFKAGEKEGDVDMMKQADHLRQAASLRQARASWSDAARYFSRWPNCKILLGTMSSWFLLDLSFYGLGLNNSIVLSAIGYSTGSTLYQTLYNTAVGNLVLVCAGQLPGYWLSVLTIDWLGRKPIQIGGFAILTILFCIIGFAYSSLSSGALLGLYILSQFFFNFGPNTTTFLIPGECFPTRYRATAHGLSAAAGKVGAIIAQIIAQPLLVKDQPATCTGRDCHPWLNHLMQIFALFMLLGTIVSFLVPETKLQTLEELAGEEDAATSSSLSSSPQSPISRHGHRRSASLPHGSPHWLSPVIRPILTSPKLRSKKRRAAEAAGEFPALDGEERGVVRDGSDEIYMRLGRESGNTEGSQGPILGSWHGREEGIGVGGGSAGGGSGGSGSVALCDVGNLMGGGIERHYL